MLNIQFVPGNKKELNGINLKALFEIGKTINKVSMHSSVMTIVEFNGELVEPAPIERRYCIKI